MARLAALGRRLLPNEAQHLFALTLVVGLLCGLVAVAFHLAIRAAEALLIDRAVAASGKSWMAWTIVTPALGGLVAGVALRWLVPGARGSGIPQVKQAFASEGGRVRFRDAFGKFVLGAIQIGSGSSLGREGPTVQICAGAASGLARVTALAPKNVRRLLPVGVAAGIAAAFNAPISAVTFTIEEIVGTLDQAVLSGVVVAAALAAVIERSILGVHPVIEVARPYGLEHPSSLAFYALLGVLAALVSVAFSELLLRLRVWFRRLKAVPVWAQPALGGLVTGGLAVLVLGLLGSSGITGGGYLTLGRALAGNLELRVLVALCIVKMLATSFSYSSGGAGGIFAPTLFIGAMLGGAVGHLDVRLLDHGDDALGAFALVGMGAVFAGVIRAPITSVLIIFEMTGGYGLVLPLMLANMTSYVIARSLRPLPIYEALLAQDGVVLPHGGEHEHTLGRVRVSEAMTREVVTVPPAGTVGEALSAGGAYFATLPVVDGARAVGVVHLAEIADSEPSASVRAFLHPGHTIRADATLLRAVVCMNDAGVRQLLVTDGTSDAKLVGILSMSDVVRAHARASSHADRDAAATGAADLRARALALPAVEIDDGTPLTVVVERLAARADRFALRSGEGWSVILREHVAEPARDEQLQQLLVAGDVALPAAQVEADAGLLAIAEAMSRAKVEVVVVTEGDRLVGVLPKARVAQALLDVYTDVPRPRRAESSPSVEGEPTLADPRRAQDGGAPE